MDRYEVLIYPRAYRDVDGIYEYIARDVQEPEIAKRQTDRIWKAIDSLESFPQSHQERLVRRFAGKGFRQLLIDNYIAIFKIDEGQKKVFVITVQHQGKNC